MFGRVLSRVIMLVLVQAALRQAAGQYHAQNVKAGLWGARMQGTIGGRGEIVLRCAQVLLQFPLPQKGNLQVHTRRKQGDPHATFLGFKKKYERSGESS